MRERRRNLGHLYSDKCNKYCTKGEGHTDGLSDQSTILLEFSMLYGTKNKTLIYNRLNWLFNMIHERINSKKYFHTDMEWQYFEISLVFTHVKVKGNLTFTNHKICVWECQIKTSLSVQCMEAGIKYTCQILKTGLLISSPCYL